MNSYKDLKMEHITMNLIHAIQPKMYFEFTARIFSYILLKGWKKNEQRNTKLFCYSRGQWFHRKFCSWKVLIQLFSGAKTKCKIDGYWLPLARLFHPIFIQCSSFISHYKTIVWHVSIPQWPKCQMWTCKFRHIWKKSRCNKKKAPNRKKLLF